MNKFLRLTSKVVVASALIGSVTACSNVPFLGRSRSANQVTNPPETAQNQSTTRRQRTNQPTQQAQNNTQGNQGNAETPDGSLNPEAPNTDGQSSGNQGVPALW